jgi:hypothetical protein
VLSRLGLEFDPGMLDFADKDHNFGLEDPVIRGTKSITLNTGAWRSLTPVQRARIVETFGRQADKALYWEKVRACADLLLSRRWARAASMYEVVLFANVMLWLGNHDYTISGSLSLPRSIR